MTEHDGWLLDLYPDADGLTLWLLGDDGARRRLHHAFPVTFYAAGPFPRLRALWVWPVSYTHLDVYKRQVH